jgi:guanylate kinase
MSKLFIICAPSGCGKTSLVNALLERCKNHQIERVVTYTTKQPRNNEVANIDYYFISADEFKAKIEQNHFLEWTIYNETYYGSPLSIIDKLKSGIAQIAIVDRAGAANLLKKIPDAVAIWIYPPSLETLQARLKHRATETQEQILARLAIAQKEIADENREKICRYTVCNDSFTDALHKLESIIVDHLSQLHNPKK